MGTRSVTIIFDDNGTEELCRIYRQHDGYPEGHGVDLAKLCDVKMVNGYGASKVAIANGMGCLAAQIIKGLKDGVGGIYIQPTGGDPGDWVEYVYSVTGKEGEAPVISCRTKPGEWPFNVQAKAGTVFHGNAKAWIRKYAKKAKAA